MVMKYISFIFIMSLIIVCAPGKSNQVKTFTKIRVLNNSEYFLKNVSLFSMSFNDLEPKAISSYRVLKYNSLRDDPLIYTTVEGQNLALYLKIPQEMEKSTYIVDSIDINYKVIHVSLQIDP